MNSLQDVFVPFHLRADLMAKKGSDENPGEKAPPNSRMKRRLSPGYVANADGDCRDSHSTESSAAAAVVHGGSSVESPPSASSTTGPVVFQRYCHVYRSGELSDLALEAAPDADIVEEYPDTGNWCLILRKR